MSEHIGVWHIRAWCELLKGDFTQAETSFTQAMDIDRNFAENHGGLAIVAFHQGRFHEASHQAKLAEKLDKHNFSGRYATSLLLKRSGEEEKSEQSITQILSEDSHLDGFSHQALIQLLQN